MQCPVKATGHQYLNDDMYLREIISNSSDDLVNVRDENFVHPSSLDSGKELHINHTFSKEAAALTIVNTGVRMSKADLVESFGTIAKFGTKVKRLCRLVISHYFFYCAYLVSEKVTVITSHNDDQQYSWKSSARGSFTVMIT